MDTIQQKTKKLFSFATHGFSKVGYEKSGIRPAQDWSVIVSVFLISFVSIGIFALYIDLQIQNGAFWSTVSSDQVIPTYTIHQKNLTDVTNAFNQKQANLDRIQNNPKIIPDPSL